MTPTENRKKRRNCGFRFLTLLLTLVLTAGVFTACRDFIPQGPTVPPDTIPKNEYRAEAFTRVDGLLQYADGDYLQGIDVSVHQGVIDWQAVADSGVQFAVLRLGYRGTTVGELYLDEQFEENYVQAKNAGLLLGVYFFSQAANAGEAAEEAQFVCDTLNGRALDLPVFYDWETVDGGERVTSPYDVELTACSLAFCQKIEESGYDAGVYFNQTYGYRHINLYELRDYTLWLAEYNETPGFDYQFHMLQYSDAGTVNGIEGSVDLDLLILKGNDTENDTE